MASTMARRLCRPTAYLQTLCKFKHMKISYCHQSSSNNTQSTKSLLSRDRVLYSAQQVRWLWAGTSFSSGKSHDGGSAEKKRPKQPANVFIQYLKKMEPVVKEQNPNASRVEIVSRVSKMWNELESEEKTRMAMQRKVLYDRYKAELSLFLENMTPEEIKAEEKIKQKKAEKKLKKERRELGIPHKPLTAFSCFVSERFQERSGENVVDYFKRLFDQWSNMSEAEKEKYHKKSSESKQTYHQEMEKWENEMMQMGRFDVVRKGTLARLSVTGKRRRANKADAEKDQEL